MNPPSEKEILSGNEAIARGAIESRIGFCASYPGTPSTEITSTLMREAERYNIYTEWSVNEKVALEAAAAASWAGIPALCSMKSLGLNVAADFLLNLNLSGSGPGGLVIVVCDDPRGHSSSNEQDSRFYAKAAYLPLIEPTTSQEAKNMIPIAFDISQRYQLPVLVRSTTRLSHSRMIVEVFEVEDEKQPHIQEIPDQLYNIPNPHLRHKELDDKRAKIAEDFEQLSINTMKNSNAPDTLIIATGVAYLYAIEAVELLNLSSVAVAKLVTTNPIPQKTVLGWLNGIRNVLFVEEVDPYVEDAILSLYAEFELCDEKSESIHFYGKRDGNIPFYGELNTDLVMKALQRILRLDPVDKQNLDSKTLDEAKALLIPRPLTFCAGCTHRNAYWAIQKVKKRIGDNLIVTGDIGCYSLGVFYNNSMNTMQAMGSGIGTACGLGQLDKFGFDKKVVAVAGDSTFFHACLPGLINARHHNANLTFIILDNATTAMTGFQTHPGSRTQHAGLHKVNIEDIILSIKPDFYSKGDATNISSLIDLIHSTVLKEGLKILLVDGICRLEERKRLESYDDKPIITIDTELCKGESCSICTCKFGCLALSWNNVTGFPEIIQDQCVRCGACVAVCPHNALKQE